MSKKNVGERQVERLIEAGVNRITIDVNFWGPDVKTTNDISFGLPEIAEMFGSDHETIELFLMTHIMRTIADTVKHIEKKGESNG